MMAGLGADLGLGADDSEVGGEPGPICASPEGSDAGIIGGGGSGRADPRLVVWS